MELINTFFKRRGAVERREDTNPILLAFGSIFMSSDSSMKDSYEFKLGLHRQLKASLH